jgi:hypothetical protein
MWTTALDSGPLLDFVGSLKSIAYIAWDPRTTSDIYIWSSIFTLANRISFLMRFTVNQSWEYWLGSYLYNRNFITWSVTMHSLSGAKGSERDINYWKESDHRFLKLLVVRQSEQTERDHFPTFRRIS